MALKTAPKVPLNAAAIRAAFARDGRNNTEIGRAAGVERVTISRWLRGLCERPRLDTLSAVAGVLDVPVEELILV